jgi:hypothetical protein
MPALLMVNLTAIASPAGLSTDTLSAWDRYVGLADTNAKTASETGHTFLRIAQSPEDLQRVQRGEVIVSEIKVPNERKPPQGAIHDWVGTIFIPGATLDQVLDVTRRYDQYPRWYGPTVVRANLLDRKDDEDRFTILYVRTVLFLTVAVEMEYIDRYSPQNAGRCYSISQSTHIDEIHDYGEPSQSRTPADDGSGYLWRTHNISKYEQRDNGVYIEQETIVLSQRIPVGYRWLVEPAVTRLARNLLEGSLRQTRSAVLAKPR